MERWNALVAARSFARGLKKYAANAPVSSIQPQ
jgi:hypothetical protein